MTKREREFEERLMNKFAREENPILYKELHIKKYKYKNKAEKQRAAQYKIKYNITLDDYNAIFEKQDGRCAICREKSKILLVVDHDHANGKVRALLCRNCNLMLGYAKDNKTILRLAIDYLKQHTR